jgi:hypothetical protein
MATRVKKRTDTSTNRESDKIIVRLPKGMRAQIADMAARHGKSMNAEVVTALVIHIMRDGEPDERTVKSALAELKQEIQYLRDTLGWRDHEPSERTQELLQEKKKDPPT